MNIRKRAKLNLTATVNPGDKISIRWRQPGEEDIVFVEDTITHTATYDEAAIIDGKLDEGGRLYIGGILIEQVRG